MLRIVAVVAVLAVGPVAWAADPALTRIAFGSCANQDKPLPIYEKIADLKPELLVLLGDNIYADLDKSKKVTPALIREKYDTLAKLPNWQRLRGTCPIMATWDDHDYGKNDAGAEWALKDEAKALMLDFFGEPSDSPRRARAGVYDAKTFGPPGKRVQVIMLDGRSFRSKLPMADKPLPGTRIVPYLVGTDPSLTLLGTEQWKWLEEQFRQPADLRLLCSGIQVVSEDHPFEKWANVPAERERLYNLIRATKATGVVVLSGDRHLAELSLDPGSAVGYPLYDLTSSGLNQADKRWRAPETNRARVAAMQYGDNFGVVRVDWDAEGGPVVGLQIRDVTGEVTIRQTFPLTLLSPKGEAAAVVGPELPEGVVGPAAALKMLGQEATVQFVVRGGRAVSGGKRILLNSEADFRSDKNFTVVVNESAMTGKLANAKFETFKGKTVRVKGTVKKYQNQIEIEVIEEGQLEFVEK
jgi:alkaline phosphatase D